MGNASTSSRIEQDCLLGLYGISTFVGYVMPNSFLYKETLLFQTIQFSISTQFKYQKHFYFKQFSLAYVHSLLLFNS